MPGKRNRKSSKSSKSRSKKSKLKEDPDLDVDDGGDIYEVETVVDKRQRKDGQWEYRVRWKGYPPSDDTWEPPCNLSDYLLEIAQRLGTEDDIFALDSKPEDSVELESDKPVSESVEFASHCSSENDLWNWTDEEQLNFNSIERINVQDPDACRKVTDARLNGIPVCLVGHVGWAHFAKRWLKPNHEPVRSAEIIKDCNQVESFKESESAGGTFDETAPKVINGGIGKNDTVPDLHSQMDQVGPCKEVENNPKHLCETFLETLPETFTGGVGDNRSVLEESSQLNQVEAFKEVKNDLKHVCEIFHETVPEEIAGGAPEQSKVSASSTEWLDLTQNWAIDTSKMLEDVGDEQVPVVRHDYKETNPIHGQVSLSKYLERCWNSTEPNNSDTRSRLRLYLHQWQFPLSPGAANKMCGEGSNNPLPNNIFGEDLLSYWLNPEKCNGDNPFQYIFMGREETMSKLHRDAGGLEITIAPIVGEKEVVLVHRSDGSTPLYHLEASLEKIDLEKFPMLTHARIYKSIIKPGEILLMPAGTFHQCRNLTSCLSYSRFHLDTVNLRHFLESMIDEDATEISHKEVIWNATTEIFHKIESYVYGYRAENKDRLDKAPLAPPSDVVRKVETLRALRHVCREIERRCEVKAITRGWEEDIGSDDATDLDDKNPIFALRHWEKLIRDVDLTLHEFRYRNSTVVPRFLKHLKRKRKVPAAHRPGTSGIEVAFSNLPDVMTTAASCPPEISSTICVGDEVEVALRGKIVTGLIKNIETDMEAAYLKYDDYSSFFDEFRPLHCLRKPVGGESSDEIQPQDVQPGKRVIDRFRHDSTEYRAVVQSLRHDTFYVVILEVGEFRSERWLPRDSILKAKKDNKCTFN